MHHNRFSFLRLYKSSTIVPDQSLQKTRFDSGFFLMGVNDVGNFGW